MQIVLDVSPLSATSTTGIGRLAIGLAEELKSRNDLEVIFFAMAPRRRVSYLKQCFGNGVYIPLPARYLSLGLSVIQKMNLPLDVFFPGAELTLNVDWLCLPLRRGKTVSLIADLTPITNPEWYSHDERLWFNRRIRAIQKNSDLIVTISHAAQQEIVRNTSVGAGKIIVSYPGISEQLKIKATRSQIYQVKKKYRLNHRFFLMVGVRGERKNFLRVLEAFKRERLFKKYNLVVAGDLDQNVKKQLPSFVIPIGQVQELDRDLAGLYAASTALVYPSLKEGFGFPVLEAYYQGTPIITSNCSSMLEIGKGISYLVNPESVSSIGKALRTVAAKKKLSGYQKKDQITLDLNSCSYKLMLDNILNHFEWK
jgi:glycosyltransferase involved in cell wall biosynthesis